MFREKRHKQGNVRENDKAVGGRKRGRRMEFGGREERVLSWVMWPNKAALRRI